MRRTEISAACPVCKVTLKGATDIGGEQVPRAGDKCVCGRCGAMLVFEITVRQITYDDLQGLSVRVRDELEAIRQAVLKVKAEREG
jgi:hypothetical protein